MNVTSTPGSLVTLTNAHITRGGEIEKRNAFVNLASLPSNTTGLAAGGGQIYVFGSVDPSSVSFASGTPSNINYVRLQHPTGEALTEVLSVDFFNGKVYASARFADGRIYHYYDGTRITDWFDGRARNQFQITAGTFGGTSATGSFQVTGGTSVSGNILRTLTVNNVSIINTTVQHTGSNNTTATAVKDAINAYTSTSGYTATVSTNTITITAPSHGISYNNYQIAVGLDGSFTVGAITHLSGGVDNAVTDITVDGVSIIANQVAWKTSNSNTANLIATAINDSASSPEYEATAVNQYVNIISKTAGTSFNNKTVVITVSGNVTTAFQPTTQNFLDGGTNSSSTNTYTPGSFIRPVKTKMYSLSDSLLHYSSVNDPTDWNTGSTGAGFINLQNHARGSEDLKAIANYFANVAVLAEQAIQIWFVDADETKNQQIQVLNNTGTIAPDSVVEFGDNDVFYLANSGIRSLRARDSSNAAFVGDIGNPIDDLIVADIQANILNARKGTAIHEPRDGRYLLAIGSKIYVFSYFPSSKVSAWSVYEPGFTVDKWAYDGTQVLARSGNTLYSLGGANGTSYDNATVTVQLPFLDAGRPATFKDFQSLDITCENTWDVSIATDPTDITILQDVGTVANTTYAQGRASIVGYSTHIAPRLTCSKTGSAKIGNLAIHFNESESG
tara:strand:+ start:1445 stop:3466 length:2022 start_codon:yes stop_codon:yes gene_type:complete